MNTFKKLISLIAASLFLATSAHAWHAQGHFYVESIAYHQNGYVAFRLSPGSNSIQEYTKLCFISSDTPGFDKMTEALNVAMVLEKEGYFACSGEEKLSSLLGGPFLGEEYYRLKYMKIYDWK